MKLFLYLLPLFIVVVLAEGRKKAARENDAYERKKVIDENNYEVFKNNGDDDDVDNESKVGDYDGEDFQMKEEAKEKYPNYLKRRRILIGRRIKRCTRTRIKPSCHVKYNGCGTRKIPIHVMPLFTSSCNKHDICYSCGGWRRWARRSCDRSFYTDMREKCKCEYPMPWQLTQRETCDGIAIIFYLAVRLAGKKAYIGTKSAKCSWCRNNCVIPYGSPTARA